MIFAFSAALGTSHFGVRWFWCNSSWEDTLSQASDMSALPSPTPGEYNTHNGPSTPAKEGDTDRPHRASDGKLRGRSKRSSDPSPAGDSEIEVTQRLLPDLVNVISTGGRNRKRGAEFCLGENGPVCSQSAGTEKRALDEKEGRIRLATRKHC